MATKKTTEDVPKVKQFCRSCGRINTRPSRQGIFFKCRYCGEYNAGPRLLNQALDPPRPRNIYKKSATQAGSVNDEESSNESGAKAEPAVKPKSALDKLFGK